MFDEKWKQNFLAEVQEAAKRGTLEAHVIISNSPVLEKEWITGEEAVRDYKTSESTLLNMRTKTFELRKDAEWKRKRGKVIYLRKALDRELVRRAKNNVVNLRKAG